ncbi:MAG: glycosyltransferase [Candidatus Bathyarchaeia archaeon]
MKIYIAVNGLGLGHIVRCHAIAKKLMESGSEVLFATYLDGLDFARRQGLRVVQSIPISYQVRSDGSVDLKATSARIGLSLGVNRFLHQLVRELKYLKSYAPDVVLVDSRLSTLLAARLLRKPVATILNQYRILLLHNNKYPRHGILDKVFVLIARLGWTFFGVLISEAWCLSETIFIPDFPPPLTISRDNLAIPIRRRRKMKFVGPIVNPNFRDGVDRAGLFRKYGLKPNKLMIYAAISGPRHEREPLVKKLVPLLAKFPSDYNIVISCGNPNGLNSPRHQGGALVFEWADEQDAFLNVCDVVISRAGHGTILKAMTLGKPLLIIPTPFQTEQLANATAARSIGIAMLLDQRALSMESLIEAITLLANKRTYTQRAIEVSQVAEKFEATTECSRMIKRLAADTS